MPRNEFCPKFALATLVDVRDFSGTTIYTRNGTDVPLQAFTQLGLIPNSGYFPDVLHLLTGHNRYELKDALATSAVALADPTVGIDANDHVWIESSTEFDVDPYSADTGYDLGFTVASSSVVSPDDPARWRITADSDWKRGVVVPGTGIKIDPGTGWKFARVTVHAQDVPTICRDIAVAGPDGYNWYGSGLSYADINEGFDTRDVSWVVDDTGHVIESVFAAANLATWTTDGLPLRNLLGFDGTEAVQTSMVSGKYRRAKYPCAWLVCPSRPLDIIEPTVKTYGAGALLASGQTTSVRLSSHIQWNVTGWMDGPKDALGGDLAWHFSRGVVPYLPPGGRVRLFQDWGDSRRAGRTYERKAYGVEYTVEQEGYRGAIIGSMVPDQDTNYSISWPERIRRRSPISFQLLQTEF